MKSEHVPESIKALFRLVEIAKGETQARYHLQADPQCHGTQPPDKSELIAELQEISALSGKIYSDLSRLHTQQISAKEIPHKEIT